MSFRKPIKWSVFAYQDNRAAGKLVFVSHRLSDIKFTT